MYKLSLDVWNSMVLKNPYRMDLAFFYVCNSPKHSSKCTYEDYLNNSPKWTSKDIWGRNGEFYESVRQAEREKFVKEDEALNGAYEIPEWIPRERNVLKLLWKWFKNT